jgi:hypothetical protein
MWMQAGSYPARNDRLVVSALLTYPGFSVDEPYPVRVRQGVRPSYQNQQMKVRPAPTPNMTVIVSGGICYVDQHDTGGQGTYVCVNDADTTLNVQPAGGAGQYRKDTVVAAVYDAEYAGSVSEWRLEIIQGPYAATAGATVRGTLPNNAQVLADIAIGPSQTSVSAANITDIRNYSVAAGGIVPITSSADMNRPAVGQVRYRYDTDTFVYGKADGTTAALLDSAGASPIGKALRARKPADTARANTTTLAPDEHLSIAVAANAVYEIDGVLYISSGSLTPDFNAAINGPAGSGGQWNIVGPPAAAPTGAAVADADVQRMAATTINGGSRSYGIANTGTIYGLPVHGLVETAGTAGNVSVDWAPTVSNATAVNLKRYSWLRLTRVA